MLYGHSIVIEGRSSLASRALLLQSVGGRLSRVLTHLIDEIYLAYRRRLCELLEIIRSLDRPIGIARRRIYSLVYYRATHRASYGRVIARILLSYGRLLEEMITYHDEIERSSLSLISRLLTRLYASVPSLLI